MRELTQKQKVLRILIRDGGWLPTFKFENHLDVFVGHRGPARISEASYAYPELIETDHSEKVYRYRIRTDNIHNALRAYPDLAPFLREELKHAGVPFKQYVQGVEYVMKDGIRVARLIKILA